MKLNNWINTKLPEIVNTLETSLNGRFTANTEDGINLATRETVYMLLDEILSAIFPGFFSYKPVSASDMNIFIGDRLRSAAVELARQAEQAYRYRCTMDKCEECDCTAQAAEATVHTITSIPALRSTMWADIEAAFKGDPAARSYDEIIMSYPCIEAIATYRIAHLLYEKNVPILPRIMTERAHSRTGIDIHPGAKIGNGFFIDHGTGVVIGETSVIGRNVKIYQGVTLGALSFPVDEKGELIKGVQRHPRICDHVTIYAEATILGNVTIGENAVIGGNVWVTHDVPANSKLYNRQPSPFHEGGSGI